MLRIRIAGIAAVLVAGTATAAAHAQSLQVCSNLTSSLESDGLHLRFLLDDYSWDAVPWLETPSGIDLYRRTLGIECGEAELMTTDPVPWNWDEQAPYPDPRMGFDFVDATTAAGTAYRYELLAVDADRQPLAADPLVVGGYATHGEALLGHGTIWRGPDCGLSSTQSVDPCPNECFPYAFVSTSPDVDQYGEETLLLYGTVTGVMRHVCNVDVLEVNFTRAVPSRCVVGVEGTTWSAAKQLYRDATR